MSTTLTRRAFAASAAAGAAAEAASAAETAPAGKLKLSVFSKHFQWTDWKETARWAAEAGFDGVDFTVRSGGHVLPARVADDMPKAVELVRKAGLDVYMITAGIVDAGSPHAEAIVRTMKQLGIRHYRWGGFALDYAKPVEPQLAGYRTRSKELADMNRQYGVCAMYHTHSGLRQVGAAIWDLWWMLKELDSRHVGINYDIGHATVEGGYGGWINSARVSAGLMRGVALKDFTWARDARGRWLPAWCQPGQGMVNFAGFLAILKEQRFDGPVQVHYEYPEVGDAHAGKGMSIPQARFQEILKRDLVYYREQFRAAGV